MNVKVFRYNPERNEEYYSEYAVPFDKSEGHTLLQILRYIFENMDSSLSYFSHCVCDRGICGRCVMDVNGSKKLACAYIPECDELIVKPKNDKFIKDIVCK